SFAIASLVTPTREIRASRVEFSESELGEDDSLESDEPREVEDTRDGDDLEEESVTTARRIGRRPRVVVGRGRRRVVAPWGRTVPAAPGNRFSNEAVEDATLPDLQAHLARARSNEAAVRADLAESRAALVRTSDEVQEMLKQFAALQRK